MAQLNFSKYHIKVPVREVGANMKVKGVTLPTRTYMSNKLVPGSNVYLEFTWITQMPEPAFVLPRVHTHDYDQVTLLIGSDPERPEYLGGEVESYLGGQKMVSDKTNALFIPKGVEHGLVTWKSFEKPHIMMSIMLGTGSFEDANPAGFNK
jgi:hypothetical protein